MYDLIICGAGPAGMTAALYAGRSGLKTVVFEKTFVGGQAATTYEIENYPGFEDIVSGPDLVLKIASQAKKFGAEVRFEEITDMQLCDDVKIIKTENGLYQAKKVILAMGAVPKTLGLERENELRGKGVSYCATCDGAFYRNKTVAVVGGGNTAAEDALFLSRFCEKIYLIHRGEKLRSDKILLDKVMAEIKIEIVFNTVVEKIIGDNVDGILINTEGTKRELKVSGLFVAIGISPLSKLVENKIEMENGYIITNELMETSVKNVYAIGDIRKKFLRQVITAAADGAIAATAAAQL